jgi:hypothetical protein
MAATIETACPACQKTIKAPADLQGKKIRCKGCGHIFMIPSNSPKPAPAAKPGAKPAAGAPKPAANPYGKPTFSEEDDNPDPYGMTYESLAPRCPHCALELDPPDATICLNCGYNTRTRNRHESKKTFEITAGDYFLWWLPALGCLLGIAALIGFDVYYLFYLEKDVDPDSFLLWKGIKFWVVAISVAAMWPQARYAFKRLILNTHPPEQEKKK